MASPRLSRSTSSPGKARGSEYSLRTSVKLQKSKADLDSELARLEEQAARNMASHKASLRKLEANMQRRHHSSTSVGAQKEQGDAKGDGTCLRADSPNLRRSHSSTGIDHLGSQSDPGLMHKRSSSFSDLSQATTLSVTNPMRKRAGSAVGNSEKATGKKAVIPDIRISFEQEPDAAPMRRFTTPNEVLSKARKKGK